MTSRRTPVRSRPPLAILSKQEIDRRIEAVLAYVASESDPGRACESSQGALEPRWISPAQLARRMRPFLSRN